MKLTNNKIYSAASLLAELNINNIKMPVKIGFFLQKNIQTIMTAAQEIEVTRTSIIQTLGEINEEGTHYIIPPAKMTEAQNELNDLFSLEQDLNIHMFSIDDFNGIELTIQQLSAIMFMVEED